MNTTLPIDEHLDSIADAARVDGSVVVVAPPGTGKTTRVPPHLFRAGLAGDSKVVMLEPRRVAARAAARRIAQENGWTLGDQVGYQVRLDRVASDRTRILVVTEGILVRMLQDDPFLEGVGIVVLDEFHERSVVTDLSLALTRLVQTQARADLKIVVMSATMDPDPVSRYLDGCPVVCAKTERHPLKITHTERPIAEAVASALETTRGDILVFLPGVGEIRRAEQDLESLVQSRDLALMALYGGLDRDRQDAVLSPCERRKVVLATNVAESSITIEGVDAVVDSGTARVMRYDPAIGIDRLELGRISRHSADQRAGRAARTGPGLCLRLWSAQQDAFLEPRQTPELLRTDITSAVLSLLAFGEDPESFSWFESPGAPSVHRAMETLAMLGAVLDGALTPLGRQLATLPVHPRLARLIIESHGSGTCTEGAMVAAILSEGRHPPGRGRWGSRGSVSVSRSDVLDSLSAVQQGSAPGASMIARAARRLDRLARARLGEPPPASIDGEEALLRAILAAYPDRVARRRDPHSQRAVMIGNKGVTLAKSSAVLDDDLFTCVDLHVPKRGRGAEMIVGQASAAQPDWLAEHLVTTDTVVRFDEVAQRVVTRLQTRYLDLLLDEKPCSSPPADDVTRALAAAAARDPRFSLGLDEQPVRGFIDRIRFISGAMPEQGVTPIDQARLLALLPVICQGRSSFAELRGKTCLDALRGMLTHQQIRALEIYAPERIRVPSGSVLELDYSESGPPVLAVRIQEMFGQKDTPSVARGRVPVMLHLLAPNNRPQQITQDLRSFWSSTYPEVRKELRSRYAKHSWPEDPLSAQPMSRPARRKKR